ncbi:MAG TPA: hypothetical protein VFQ61_22030 [Polyangiaceae bacterium]|nr:hypothetical protein [Polyangiaceae bacterium]
MPTEQELRNNPVYQRQQVRNALASLENEPEELLANVTLTCSAGAGHQTVLNPAGGFALNAAGDQLKIGINAPAAHYPHRLVIPMLETQTRSSAGAGLAQRLAASPRFAIGGAARVWITDQQTGCTVLALDWGGGQYSMFHLLPYENAAFGALARASFFVSKAARSVIKNSSLRSEATQVVTASQNGGAPPQRYILLQSQHNINKGRLMQVVGVKRNGGWDFFRQVQTMTPAGPRVHSVKHAPWRPWTERFYHDV